MGAEVVLGDAGVEGIGGEVVFALEKSESTHRDDQVEVGRHRADRAVAAVNLEHSGCVDLEADATAVASATMSDIFRWFVSHKDLPFLLVSRSRLNVSIYTLERSNVQTFQRFNDSLLGRVRRYR